MVQVLLSLESLRMVYFSYFHSLLTYRIIFWGNSRHNNTIFRLQKTVIRIITGIRNRDSCREHFRTLKILPLQSQYILSLLLFVIDNKDRFRRNSEIHHINTRYHSRFYPCLSGHDNFKAVPGLVVWKFEHSVWHCFYKVYCLFCWRNERLSVMLYAFSSPRNLSLFW